jgi:hypothetical protein
MKSPLPPPSKNPFPLNWDLEDEGAGATREVGTDELFELSGFLDEMMGPMPPAVVAIPPPPPSFDFDLPPMFDETQPLSRPPATMRPSMSQAEYVEHMMRQAPPSEAGAFPLGEGAAEAFGMLTPWPASVPPERDPAAVSLSSINSEALAAARLPSDLEDPSGRGSGTFEEAEFDELMPDFLGHRDTPAAPPPQILMDELDQLLIDEVMRAVRPGPGEPAVTTRSPGLRIPMPQPLTPLPPPPISETFGDMGGSASEGLDLAYDDPLFVPPSEAGLTRVLSMLDPRKSEPPAPSTEPIDVVDISMPPPLGEPLAVALGDVEPMPSTVAPDTVQDTAHIFEVTARQEGSPRARLDKVRARFEVGDFSGALVLAEAMLEEDPRHLAATCYADSCRAMLRQMYLARIGDKASVLRQVMDSEQVMSLQLDHRAGFLLSLADGMSTIDEILDVSGMPALDALRMLYELIQEGVLEAEPPPSVRGRGERRMRRLRGEETPGGAETKTRRR